jgi:hypothetical protein
MPVLFICRKATKEEIQEMSKILQSYIKVAVDISKGVLAGGGALHAECESILIRDGSKQEDVWGADWVPKNKEVRFEAMINIAPRRKNRSMMIQDPLIREKVSRIIRNLLDI